MVVLGLVFGAFLYSKDNAPVGNTNIYVGSKVTFKAASEGTQPISYYWYKDGSFISASDTIVFNKISNDDVGIYTVVAQNVAGEASNEIQILSLATQPNKSTPKEKLR